MLQVICFVLHGKVPRKTKKQKRKADIHRRFPVVQKEKSQEIKQELTTSKKREEKKVPQYKDEYEEQLAGWTKRDLVKTAVTITIVVAIQFAIVYARETGLF